MIAGLLSGALLMLLPAAVIWFSPPFRIFILGLLVVLIATGLTSMVL